MILQNNSSTTTKISEANQTALPSLVRRALKIKKGDRLIWELDSKTNVISVRALPQDLGSFLRGSGKGVYGDVDKYIRELRKDRPIR